MTDWNRKNLDALHSAITVKLRSDGHLNNKTAQLNEIKSRILTSFGSGHALTLHNCRAALCNVCRKDKMYECDVAAGWSPTCTFIKSNYFGSAFKTS